MRSYLTLFLLLGLCSCADIYQGSFDAALADAAVRNNLPKARANANPRNATMLIKNEQPIYWAAAHGNEDMLDLFYNNGASLQYRTSTGKSLAYVAAANGHRGTADKLVQLGAGSSVDLSSGAAAYSRTVARRKTETAAALAFIGLMAQAMMSGGGGSGETCDYCSQPATNGRYCNQHWRMAVAEHEAGR